jgi:arsenate reductase
MTPVLLALCLVQTPPAPTDDPGPFVRALWLVQRNGTPAAVDPANDVRTKAALAKGLGKDGVLTANEIEGLMEPETFKKLAGADARLDATEIARGVESGAPQSRGQMLPKIRAHADALTTSFDMIDEPHRRAGETLAEWIAANYQTGRPLNVIVVCTGNSRRSILGSTMGNIAAAYCGMPEIRFQSGGTAPTAFNGRTVATLKEIGVEVEPLGDEAPRGEPKTANPRYRVRWGTPGLETVEFSKHYADPANPHAGFAALMVCGEADAACPFVKGATLRVSMPYLDPKIYDDSTFETAKYAERRDDIGRLMLATMIQARSRLNAR